MADLEALLEKTSRTFALSIPRLPEPTRLEVTLAYLLFRIADTFEDSATWPRSKRIAALDDFRRLLDDPRAESVAEQAAAWTADVPIDHEGYLELISEVPAVLAAYAELSPAAREHLRVHTARTCRCMAGYVERTDDDGELSLRDIPDLQDYCYCVAGIVGEMLTELFLLDRPELEGIAEALRSRSRAFGEALQLVNIVKDAAFDATEGRSYLPPSADRDEVFALARHDLEIAAEYITALQEGGAPTGIVAFNALNVLLAFAAIDRVEKKGPGAKISRLEVFNILRRMDKDLDKGRPVMARAKRS